MTWQLCGNTWKLVDAKFSKGLNLFGPDWRPLWRNTTATDVAGLLADAELILDIEKAPKYEHERRRSELAPRRAELVHQFIYRFPGHRRLEMLAEAIDGERLFYECSVRETGAPTPTYHQKKRRRRLREGATTLERKLREELQYHDYYDADTIEIKGEYLELLERLSRFRLLPRTRFVKPWHRFAHRICCGYVRAIAECW